MAKKDAYYFPHFIGARNDNKILKVRRILGIEGYAIYFMLLEVLREQKDFKYPVDLIAELEFDFRISKEKISNLIFDYGLFKVDKKNLFYSPMLIQYMQPYLDKSERARLAAIKRWDANGDANASPNEYPKAIQKQMQINNKINNKENKPTGVGVFKKKLGLDDPEYWEQANKNSFPDK